MTSFLIQECLLAYMIPLAALCKWVFHPLRQTERQMSILNVILLGKPAPCHFYTGHYSCWHWRESVHTLPYLWLRSVWSLQCSECHSINQTFTLSFLHRPSFTPTPARKCWCLSVCRALFLSAPPSYLGFCCPILRCAKWSFGNGSIKATTPASITPTGMRHSQRQWRDFWQGKWQSDHHSKQNSTQ